MGSTGSTGNGTRGRFYWYELLTSDVEAARAFYTQVIGWSVLEQDMGGFVYPMWTNVDGALGGVARGAESPGLQGAPPHWVAYVGTPDVDATVARAVALGAVVHAPPMDIPGTGRMAVLTDPQGAVFAVFTPASPIPASNPHTPGAFSWHELYTTDPDGAWSFYAELFGWERTGAMNMGPAGEYRMFGCDPEKSCGGVMTKAPEMPGPANWLYYVTVPDIAAALERVRAHGGQVVWGPQAIPGNDTVATCLDPQGAVFAVYQSGPAAV